MKWFLFSKQLTARAEGLNEDRLWPIFMKENIHRICGVMDIEHVLSVLHVGIYIIHLLTKSLYLSGKYDQFNVFCAKEENTRPYSQQLSFLTSRHSFNFQKPFCRSSNCACTRLCTHACGLLCTIRCDQVLFWPRAFLKQEKIIVLIYKTWPIINSAAFFSRNHTFLV